mmetsp:Transcript_44075/g.122137  ORF Transcript_44075/g.122137 Transcript_44075/m.122137 type:complete len:241 (-) Transcript_44075:30-752(-)
MGGCGVARLGGSTDSRPQTEGAVDPPGGGGDWGGRRAGDKRVTAGCCVRMCVRAAKGSGGGRGFEGEGERRLEHSGQRAPVGQTAPAHRTRAGSHVRGHHSSRCSGRLTAADSRASRSRLESGRAWAGSGLQERRWCSAAGRLCCTSEQSGCRRMLASHVVCGTCAVWQTVPDDGGAGSRCGSAAKTHSSAPSAPAALRRGPGPQVYDVMQRIYGFTPHKSHPVRRGSHHELAGGSCIVL